MALGPWATAVSFSAWSHPSGSKAQKPRGRRKLVAGVEIEIKVNIVTYSA